MFDYNSKSKLTSAVLGNNDFSYDADGNATQIQTPTGTWNISYNGENRPVRFENAGTQTVVECGYDSLGRRFEKKVTVAGTLVLHERYAYRGYLQIAAFDIAGTLKRVIYWDPTEETATRPLAVNILGDNVYFPTIDLTKNVCELVDFYGNVAATYDYAPFGAVSAGTPSGAAVPANPLQWSSEIYDSELDLVYYNHRHYSPALGRWLSRDPIEEQGGLNLYAFVVNSATSYFDDLGTRKRRGRQFRGTRYKTRKNAKRLQMSQGLVFCANYKRYQNGKCCRNGNIVEDSYPKNAQTVCEGFIKDYAGTAMGQSAICVAKCLSQNEEEMSKISDCANRNSARLESHVACYAKCLFVPYYGLPDGGWDVGINDLFPDYWETRILPIFE